MQPLSRIKPSASVLWGDPNTMIAPERAKVSALIADCIAEWADTETMLGMLLGILLNTDSKAALAIYAAVDNRAAQRRIVLAAAEAKLSEDHFDLLSAVFNVGITPAMKERDKLAHWSWGYSPELPDCLLLTKPDNKMALHFQAIHTRVHMPQVSFDPSTIFVVTEPDLSRLAKRMRDGKEHLSKFMASIWDKNSQQQRDEWRQKLSNEPQIREAWDRLRAARQKNQESP